MYPKQCYKMLKPQDDIGRINFVSKVRGFLFMYGFGFAWISQEVDNPAQCKVQFKHGLKDCFFSKVA